MSKPINISAAFPGKTQINRVLPALDPRTFAVDERDRADLLAFTVKFAKAISYFDPRNKLNGNWRELLLADPVMLTAYISKTDTQREFSKYLDYQEGIQATTCFRTQLLFTQQFFSIGFHLFLRINRWFRLAGGSQQNPEFREHLQGAIREQGRTVLRDYYLLYFTICENAPALKNEILIKLEDLDRIWLFEPFPCTPCVTFSGDQEAAKMRWIKEMVQEAVSAGQKLFHFQEQIIDMAGNCFSSALQRPDIAPHIGLLLTFLDLLQYQQEELNSFTQSHLDFYYRSVLGCSPLAAQPDTTFVSFQLAKSQPPFLLKKGTALAAGSDAQGKPLSFCTTAPLRITAGTIKQYLSLNFEKSEDDAIINGIYSGTFKSADQLNAASWPLFGGTVDEPPNFTVKENNFLGFAFSCPDLIMNSGERSIVLKFFPQTAPPDLATDCPPKTTANCQQNTLDLLDFEITTPKGWKTVEGASVWWEIKGDYFQVTLHFSSGDPSIIPYNPKIHGPGFSTNWPVCKANIHPGIKKEDYKKLRNFSFNEVVIACTVEGAESLVLQNDRGKLSPKITFPPFGNAPLPGANFYIGQQEFFVKPLTALDLHILWDHLPEDFATYYQEYTGTFDNAAFQATLGYLAADGQWKVLADKRAESQFPLFIRPTTQPQSKAAQFIFEYLGLEHPICNPRKLSFDLNGKIPAQADLPAFNAFSQEMCRAFFRLQFSAPETGFGSEQYAKLIGQITMENGQAIIANAQNCKSASTPDCQSITFCKALASGTEKIRGLEISYQDALSKLTTNSQLVTDCVKEVCGLLSCPSGTHVDKDLIPSRIKNYQDALQTSLQNNQQQLVHTLQLSIGDFADLLKVLSKDAPKTNLEILSGFEKTAQGIIEEKAGAFLKALPDISDDHQQLLETLKKPLFHLLGELSQKQPKTKTGLKNLFRRKKTKELVAGTDQTAELEKILTEIEALIAKISSGLIQLVVNQFQHCSDTLIEPDTDTSDTSADLKKKEKAACSKFRKCMQIVNGFLDDYLIFSGLLSFVFLVLDDFLGELKLQNCNNYTPLKPLPNRPFVPKVKSLSADYQSCQAWKAGGSAASNFQWYHLSPFGTQQISTATADLDLFPDYAPIPYAFLGLQNLYVGESLTILFVITNQLKSLDSQTESKICYEYLTDLGWQRLSLQADSTSDFEQTGIIQFQVPADMTDQSTAMPAGYFWLRISQRAQKQTIIKPKPKTVFRHITTNYIATQAVPVARVLDEVSDFQLIAAGTIKTPTLPISAIRQIRQPLPSSGGRGAEAPADFYQRVAYRLNHKNRAVLPADLEHLVLQFFPLLFQVKAVPMTYFPSANSRQICIVLVPWKKLSDEHAYRPLSAPAVLRQVMDFLQDHCPPNLPLKIANPDFVELKVITQVKYNTQEENMLLNKQLNGELMQVLSPWIKDNPFQTSDAGVWDLAKIRGFIQSRPYVESVEQIGIQTCTQPGFSHSGTCPEERLNQELKPWQLIVSSFDHEIKQSSTKQCGDSVGNSAPEIRVNALN